MVLWVGSPKCAALGAAFVPDVEGCVLWLLLKSSTSRLLNFIPSPHSALTELLNLPLQVINYLLKSGCPIKESIKTPDTCIIYDLHWNPPKLLPLHPRAIFFTIIFPFLSSSRPQAELPCALGGLLCIITPRTTDLRAGGETNQHSKPLPVNGRCYRTCSLKEDCIICLVHRRKELVFSSLSNKRFRCKQKKDEMASSFKRSMSS